MRTSQRVAYRFLYARLILAMSLDRAKVILGLGDYPSEKEVLKAWKTKAFENHPDRGGNHTTMVEINVARDVLLGKQRPTEDRQEPATAPEPPHEPEKKTTPPKYQAATLDEANRAAGGPLGRAYWKWITAFVNFDPESDEARELGALDTGWVAYGWDAGTENHVFLPIGTGMYTFGNIPHGSRETWWVGSPVTLSRKVPTAKAIVSGLTKAVSQIEGLSKTNKIYTFPGYGKRSISQKEVEAPKGSPTTIQEWLEQSGLGKETPFKLTVRLHHGPKGDWDRQITVEVNQKINLLSPKGVDDFRSGLAKKLLKKDDILFWDTTLDVTRMKNPKEALLFFWGYRDDFDASSVEALQKYLMRMNWIDSRGYRV
jgi:hypothetical protein